MITQHIAIDGNDLVTNLIENNRLVRLQSALKFASELHVVRVFTCYIFSAKRVLTGRLPQSDDIFSRTTTRRHTSLPVTRHEIDLLPVVNTARVLIEFPLTNS